MTRLDSVEEGSTKVVTLSFTDEDGVALLPTSITWSLFDELGNIVNSRSDVSVSPATSVNIVLSTNDLQYKQSQKSVYLVANAVYTSDYGTGLPLVDWFEIPIEKVVGE